MSLKILEMLISGVVFKTTVVNQILNAELTSVFHFVWKVPWRKIVESGWPLFGLLAKLWRDVQNLVGFDIQKMDSYLVSYLKRIEEPPSLQMSAEAFRHLHVWKTNEFNVDRVGAGSVYLAVADWRRRHEEENSDWWLLVEQARAHLSPLFDSHPEALFLSAWPVWRQMELISAQSQVRVHTQPNGFYAQNLKAYYVAAVFPFQEKVSDYVRACGRPYCENAFLSFMVRLPNFSPSELLLVEAGANLGDCSLWSVMALNVTAVLIEPQSSCVARAEMSKRLNNLGERVSIIEAIL
eukprot:gnl/MRDRNA2_/MRDRNA2_83992_c0_seq6.p1 gnl/MRDRNA2_/MRDRNA2_83992_c0~~gnl/MRDRNA2_/MRDRNA2_83992_c0_seq6.p1  ORF type:complete len:309 (+),score=44.71 gnl/MRDRNA2_/MRDRNA2_83992_c0_seq6:44-928(+)